MEIKKIDGKVQNTKSSANDHIRGIKRCLFEGTILDGAIMVYVNNVPVPMVLVEEDYAIFYSKPNPYSLYQNIITGEIYQIPNSGYIIMDPVKCVSMVLPSDTKKEPLISFLTQEEGQKAMTGNFTDLDAWNLSQRVAIEAKTSQSR